MISQHDDARTPVLIAGAGPAGLAAASELAHHGIRSVVVEPRREVSHLRPRAKTTSARTMELFRRWGVADAVRRAAAFSPEWCRRVVFCDTLDGPAITEFQDVFGLSATECGLAAEPGQQVTQPVVEEVLRAPLARTGLAELRLGERLLGLTEQPDGVTCEVVRADGSTYRLVAEYLLGCDGGRSTVRDGIGATLHGDSAPRANLNAVIRAPGLRPAAGPALHYWVVGTDVPGVVGPLDHDGTWWVTLGDVGDSADTGRAVELIAELAGRPAAELGIEVLSTDPWTPRMMLADRFATDRVFLVGESAHVNPPLGGHGFNTCVGDAVNIGWKIAAVLRGWAGPGLPASYEAERRGVAELTIASAVRNLRASGPDRATTADRIQETKAEEFHSLGLVLGYFYAGSPVIAEGDAADPPPLSVRSYVPTTLPGARLPHAWVAPGHALYDDLGRGMTLLRPPDADAEVVHAFAGRAADLGVPLTLLDFPAGIDWAEDYLLVRPDQHIAWRGRDLEAADLSRLCGITPAFGRKVRNTMVVDPAPRDVHVPHGYPEQQVDLGEITMNYAEAGEPDKPAVLLIPEQTGSWWGYEETMGLLAEDFHVYAVDLRGQGRSTWTPKRYSLDNFGNDLVRFIALVVKRPVIVAGNSSGGVLAAWLSAYSMPGQVRGALCEDAPFFSSELVPTCGHSIRQAAGPLFELFNKYLGDQWSVGDWEGYCRAAGASPSQMARYFVADEIPQHMKEYDPEWARVFWEGTVALHCPHERMLTQVKTPVLLTHHMRGIDPDTGALLGALSDEQAARARLLMESAGVKVDYESVPDALHMMHQFDPPRYVKIFTRWAATLAM